MKVNSNFRITLGVVISLLFMICCKKGPATSDSVTPNPNISMDTLSQNAIKGNGNQYRMRILSQPDVIEAGKKVVFSLTPQIVGKETEPVPLDNDHGYDIHLIIVSNDLSWFDHRHPGLSDLGSYEQTYTFDKGGLYLLYADYKPMGSTDTVQIKSIGVNGNAEKEKTYSESKMTSITGAYEVSISPGESGKFESEKMQTITATISKGSIPVDANTLGDYLGSKGHMVIIGVKDKNFLHVHPSVENGNLIFHTSFKEPGLYRAWLQFQNENIVQTADFVILVEQGTSSSMEEDRVHQDQH